MTVATLLWHAQSIHWHAHHHAMKTTTPYAHSSPAHPATLPCLILTVSQPSGLRVNMDGLLCVTVHAKEFEAADLQHVRADVREQLYTRQMHRYESYVMSNNNTVNIFNNHAMLWRMVVRSNQSTLILEDDAQLDDRKMMQSLLRYLQTKATFHNYIVKLQNTLMHSFYGWTRREFDNTTVFMCTCMPPIVNFGMVAYVIDPVAAQTLLNMYQPIWTHVDTWVHRIGCERKINLFSAARSLFSENGRPSFHRSSSEKPSLTEKIVHIASDFMHSNCTTKSDTS